MTYIHAVVTASYSRILAYDGPPAAKGRRAAPAEGPVITVPLGQSRILVTITDTAGVSAATTVRSSLQIPLTVAGTVYRSGMNLIAQCCMPALISMTELRNWGVYHTSSNHEAVERQL